MKKSHLKPLRDIAIQSKIVDGLFLSIDTPSLLIRSVMPEDEKALIRLMSDLDVMKAHDKMPLDDSDVKDILKTSLKRWQSYDPLGAYIVFAQDSKELIGFINLAAETHPSNVNYVFLNKKYIPEATDAISQALTQKLMLQKGKKTRKFNPTNYSIQFKKTNDNLYINVETERLCIRSVSSEDRDNFIKLLTDPEVTEKNNGPLPEEFITKTILERSVNRWNHNDPYSVYVLCEKNSKEFVGMITLGAVDLETLNLGFSIHKKFWRMKYTSEAATAIFQVLLPQLMLQGYQPKPASLPDCKHLKNVKTLRGFMNVENIGSKIIIERTGLKKDKIFFEKEKEKEGHLRFHLTRSASHLRNEYLHFFTRRDRKQYEQDSLRLINQAVDVTAEEMASSPFGKRR